jgi:sugar lactone lactonase YvrE
LKDYIGTVVAHKQGGVVAALQNGFFSLNWKTQTSKESSSSTSSLSSSSSPSASSSSSSSSSTITTPTAKNPVYLDTHSTVHRYVPEEEITTDKIHDPEPHLPNNRFNDGKTDPFGRFWAGTMSLDEENGSGKGSLYCLDSDGKVHKVFFFPFFSSICLVFLTV